MSLPLVRTILTYINSDKGGRTAGVEEISPCRSAANAGPEIEEKFPEGKESDNGRNKLAGQLGLGP